MTTDYTSKRPLASRVHLFDNRSIGVVDTAMLKSTLGTSPVDSTCSREVSPASTVPMSEGATIGSSAYSKNATSLLVHMKRQARSKPDTLPENREARRKAQVELGKNTFNWRALQRLMQVGCLDSVVPAHVLAECPKHSQLAAYYAAPSTSSNCSNRAFDGYLREWRQRLHHFDTVTCEDLCMTPADYTALVTVALQNPTTDSRGEVTRKFSRDAKKEDTESVHFRVVSDPTISSEASSK